MIEHTKRRELIDYRIEQAKLAIDETKILIDNDMLRVAVNRIYYGMFYILLALGLKYEFETSKHQQLIGWFNKNFIKDSKIDRKFGIILREAYEYRQQGDYATFVEFSKEEVMAKFQDMQLFVAEIEKLVS